MKIDPSILTRALAGDPVAAAGLIESIWPDAYRIARAALRDSHAAEDAAQEACARAWTALGSVRETERFPTWFYRIVVNECNRKRHSMRRELRLLERLPTERESTQDERIDVHRAIDSLPSTLRLTIILRYYYDLSSLEIAGIVGVSPITVRWRLMLAHRRMRDLLRLSEGYNDETVAVG